MTTPQPNIYPKVSLRDCDMSLIKYLSIQDKAELEFLRCYQDPTTQFHFYVVGSSKDLIVFIARPIREDNAFTGEWEVVSECGTHQFIFDIE